MKYAASILAGTFLLTIGCSAPTPPPPLKAPDDTTTTAPADPYAQGDNALVMSGINLYMHRSHQLEGVAQKPQFWVHANQFSIQGANQYIFEDARAVIYGSSEEEESIVIEAKRGQFEQDKRASLQEDVLVKAGTMNLKLIDIDWEKPEDDTAGIAKSDNKVVIDDPNLQLEAGSLRLYPDTKKFELTQVTGMVRFGKESL